MVVDNGRGTKKAPKSGEAPALSSKTSADTAGATKGLTPEETKARESKKFKILQRVVMSLLMIFSFFSIVWLGHPFLVALVVIIQVGCFKELVNVRYQPAKEKEAPLFRTMQWLMFSAAMVYTYMDQLNRLGFNQELRDMPFVGKRLADLSKYRHLFGFSAYVVVFVTFVCTLKKSILKYQIGNMVWTAGILGLTVLQVKGTIRLIFGGIFWFILSCGLVVANDCFAYICGMSMGRRLTSATFLSISPNKTWEGFIGALFCTVGFAYVFADLLARSTWFICPQHTLAVMGPSLSCPENSMFVRQTMTFALDDVYTFFTVEARPVQLHAVALACFASLVAPFGGFLASGIKRAYNIKDFGDLIPGHGGFMDRIDCQLLMLLCTTVYCTTFVFGGATEEHVLRLVAGMPRESKERLFQKLGEMLS